MTKCIKSIKLIFNKLNEVKLTSDVFSNSSKLSNLSTLLDIAKLNNIDIEAACDSSLACSTCHVILNEDIYDKLYEPSDDELDMLEIAPDLTDTSRLSCQIKLIDILSLVEKDNIHITIPDFNKNSEYKN